MKPLQAAENMHTVEYEDSFSKILSYLERNMSKDIGLDQMAQAIIWKRYIF
jgi:hypothetical protein